MKYPWEQSIWVYIANNTQISEHKESSTEIVIMYWSTSVLIYVSKWIKQINMASVELKELSTFKTWFALFRIQHTTLKAVFVSYENYTSYMYVSQFSSTRAKIPRTEGFKRISKRALLKTVIALFQHQVTLSSGY